MNDLIKLFTEYSFGSILIFIFLILSSIAGVYSVFTKITSLLEVYRIRRNSIEDRDKKIDDAIKQVEAITEVQTERIKKDEDRIEELEKSTKTINENLNKFNKATSRNAVYKLANELIAKQWMSQSDYESLQELSDVYMKSGDSHYVIPNIIQRALNLPVLTDEEIEAKMSRHRADFKL